MFTPDETRRYARHLVLKGFGGAGQQRLAAARVLVVGAGGLGAPVIAYLAAAGVGTLGVVDNDAVSLANLQRQVIFAGADIGAPKVEAAAAFVTRLNPHVRLLPHGVRLDTGNAQALIAGYDIVVDGCDSLATRRVVAAACDGLGKPLVSGAVSMFDGQVTTILPGSDRPKLADLYGGADEGGEVDCEAVGVLGPVTGVIGTLMAMETIKLATGVGAPLVGRVLLYDGRAARFTELRYGPGA